jgi:hypothetical protein
VLRQARGDFFMWAADDDRWDSVDLIEKLGEFAPCHSLTFPNCHLSSADRIIERAHLDIYSDCVTPMDYLRCWCGHGTGYPIYGLYNLNKMNEEGLSFVLDADLSYYNEGTFLHRVFLNGSVKFVRDAYIIFSTDSSKPNPERLIADFKMYFARTLQVYGHNRLDPADAAIIYSIIIENYTNHLLSLQEHSKPMASLRRKAKDMKMLFSRSSR